MSDGQPFAAAELPLQGLRLIEASAGTGKTFSLAGLYLRLIVEKDASVRDILVMTFTRAATQELRERIRARLADAARIAYAPEHTTLGNAEHAFAQRILANRDEDRTTLARRLAAAAARVDEATIVTIHGFAQRAATENAFESALAFDRGEAVDDPSVQREAAVDYWREHVFGGNDAGGDVLALWSTPDQLYETIAPVLVQPHVRLAGIDDERLAALQKELAETWPGTVEPLAQALTAARADDALRKNETLNTVLAEYADAAEPIAELDARITAALTAGRVPVLPEWVSVFTDLAAQFKTRPKASQAYAEPLAELPALGVLAALQPLARLLAIRKAVTAVRQRAAARKNERREYSYDDLIAALFEALTDQATGDRLADALHARWPFALVDEFQDTDPLQYASLRRIYLDRPREHGALLLIGDPKQAIYGFRGGDIYTYLAAARAAGADRYTLKKNYRASQSLLDAIEALYKLSGERPFEIEDIDFPHVEAGRKEGDKRIVTNDGELAALTVWELQGGVQPLKNGNRRNPSKADDNARLIEHTIARIGWLLDGESAHWEHADGGQAPVAARDIAVLVNNHREATALQAALAQRGIMAVCQHRDSVFASDEANDLRLILRAMAAPDDAIAVRAAQPTALLGKRLRDLIALADDDHAMQLAVERFQMLHQSWSARGVLAALERLFMAAAPDLLALTDGERRMSNYLQLGELLAGAEAECFGMAGVVRWLDDHIAAAQSGRSAGIDDESQLRLESDADLVRIRTVHAAKGLEYPVVFLPFAPWLGTSGSPDKPPLIFHDDHGRARIDLIGTAAAHKEQAAIEARSEALRLLYVALTRAEQAVIVGWREPDDYANPGALAHLLRGDGAAAGSALTHLKHDHRDAITIETLDLDDPPPAVEYRSPLDADALVEARRDLPAGRPRWSTYSFSRLAHAPTDTRLAELPEPGAEDELVNAPADAIVEETGGKLPRLDERLAGVRFGSAVHDILEAWVSNPRRGRWPAPSAALTDEQHDFVARRLRQHGLIAEDRADPRIADTANLVARTLHTPLPEIGPLAALGAKHTLAEMEFMLRLRGNRLGALIETLRDADYLSAALGGDPMQTLYGLMQGFIDLIAEVDGRYYVLDYKTNRLGETPAAYTQPALKRAIGRAHYDLQYLIYSVALHRHLRRCLGDAYDAATQLGGVQYLFVRAMDGETETGVFTDRPDVGLVEALDALFDHEFQLHGATA